MGVGGCDSVLELLVGVAKDLRDKRYNAQVVAKIVALNKGLKTYGPQLELTHKEAIDRYQVNKKQHPYLIIMVASRIRLGALEGGSNGRDWSMGSIQDPWYATYRLIPTYL